jgi:hypothetical protein
LEIDNDSIRGRGRVWEFSIFDFRFSISDFVVFSRGNDNEFAVDHRLPIASYEMLQLGLNEMLQLSLNELPPALAGG